MPESRLISFSFTTSVLSTQVGGAGSVIMAALCEGADRFGVRIVAQPELIGLGVPGWDMPKNDEGALGRWSERFGFIHLDTVRMERQPSGSSVLEQDHPRICSSAQVNGSKSTPRLCSGESRAKNQMRRDHLVPLPTPAVAVFRELQRISGDGKHVFPSLRGDSTPMSENTINGALRALGHAGNSHDTAMQLDSGVARRGGAYDRPQLVMRSTGMAGPA